MLAEIMKILLMTIVVMGLVLGGIIYFNEKNHKEKLQQVASISLVLGESLPKVTEVGISIGEEFKTYSIAEIRDTVMANISVSDEVNPPVRVRYHYENKNFLEIKALPGFENQGLSGTNEFILFQDSITYDYRT